LVDRHPPDGGECTITAEEEVWARQTDVSDHVSMFDAAYRNQAPHQLERAEGLSLLRRNHDAKKGERADKPYNQAFEG
jgi:hypothetical protein